MKNSVISWQARRRARIPQPLPAPASAESRAAWRLPGPFHIGFCALALFLLVFFAGPRRALAQAQLVVDGNQTFTITSNVGYGFIIVGDGGGNGTVNQNSGAVTVSNGFLLLGDGGSTAPPSSPYYQGSYYLYGGSLNVSGTETLGYNNYSGYFIQYGGTNTCTDVSLGDWFQTGTNALGKYDLEGGTLNTSSIHADPGSDNGII